MRWGFCWLLKPNTGPVFSANGFYRLSLTSSSLPRLVIIFLCPKCPEWWTRLSSGSIVGWQIPGSLFSCNDTKGHNACLSLEKLVTYSALSRWSNEWQWRAEHNHAVASGRSDARVAAICLKELRPEYVTVPKDRPTMPLCPFARKQRYRQKSTDWKSRVHHLAIKAQKSYNQTVQRDLDVSDQGIKSAFQLKNTGQGNWVFIFNRHQSHLHAYQVKPT